uniref:Uncharacterized protein n=1 Tax=Octopus bimaculoides TaxID=37653 RepID=A0A0L8HZ59_OCTBM
MYVYTRTHDFQYSIKIMILYCFLSHFAKSVVLSPNNIFLYTIIYSSPFLIIYYF